MHSWSVDSEDDSLSWVGASWKRSQKLVEQDLERYRPKDRSRDFSGESPEQPEYDPWTGGYY